MPITAADDFAISLDFFSGPMDLLLHLVHQQEVAIEQVSMKLIAEQYLAILSRARLLDLDKASEYLVIAATLMAIKSASLLPSASLEDPDAELAENSERFYEELRARLRAYELTKSRARALVDLPQLGVNVYSRNDRAALQPTPEMLAEPEEAHTLASMFGQLLKRVGGTISSYKIRLEAISVVSYMMRIVDSFSDAATHLASGGEGNSERRSFRSFVRGYLKKEGRGMVGSRLSPVDRGIITGSFIAVLELMKRGLLAAEQRDDGADIQIALKMSPAEGKAAPEGTFESEFDAPSAMQTEGDSDELQTPAHESNVVDFEKYKRDKHSVAVEKPRLKEVGNSGS